jgi:hypothetical protein
MEQVKKAAITAQLKNLEEAYAILEQWATSVGGDEVAKEANSIWQRAILDLLAAMDGE